MIRLEKITAPALDKLPAQRAKLTTRWLGHPHLVSPMLRHCRKVDVEQGNIDLLLQRIQEWVRENWLRYEAFIRYQYARHLFPEASFEYEAAAKTSLTITGGHTFSR